ncbi:M61 family metallopeptidase [Lysobacter silvisoli]|uniref:M61 family peptidase n=1 Tax=Lysobacter silvisoli TaxID=2293254 RepID=A0A371JYG6_9GAMM|nr:M61 family metallopeptidase [Lysobacter silvisoli]RDZ26660.1 M61 family peptidase [Lysobacter silvisoli]
MPQRSSPALLPLLIAALLPAAAAAQTATAVAERDYAGTMSVEVDASDVVHRVFRTRQRIPVQAGPLTLWYPQWLPGNHSPTGPINKLAGLQISGNGQRIAWTRDPLDVYAFRLSVPEGVSAIEVAFDYLSPTGGDQGRVVMGQDLLSLQWNAVALYPAGYDAGRIAVSPSLKLPAGWGSGTALEVESRQGDTVRYKPVSFETLVDSPLFAGRHYRQVDLAPGAQVPVRLNVVADAPKYLEAKPEQLSAHRRMVEQALRLFRSQHYDHYDFLFSLSDQIGGIGLEHHRSSENGVDPEYFTDWDKNPIGRDLLAHEFVHSWNGKFRRPVDLDTPHFNVPMQDSLLWVYEGQTQYWGYVLTARAGMWKEQTARDALAMTAATYALDRPGFAWRNVQDTTNDPIIALRRPQAYRSQQLSEDYYAAGQLIWLAVDAKLRELSGERRSLDDFAAAFFGVDDGSYAVKTYTFDDVTAALDGVAKHDWAAFLRSRLDANAAPLDGLAAAGWRLVYSDQPSDYVKQSEGMRKVTDLNWSLGMVVANKDNAVSTVRWDGPAFNAGLAPGCNLLAVNGYAYEGERLKDAITAAKEQGTPIELIVKQGDAVRSVRIDYREGLKYPSLERIPGTPDRLSKILAPK